MASLFSSAMASLFASLAVAPAGAVARNPGLPGWRLGRRSMLAGPPRAFTPIDDPNEKTQKLAPQLVWSTAALEDLSKEAEPCGPRGMLLVGISDRDGEAIRSWLQNMEPGFVVSHASTDDFQKSSLEAALGGAAASTAGQVTAKQWQPAPFGTPPVCFFSGMRGEEVVAIVENFEEFTGLKPPAFASVTTSTLGKSLSALITDVVRSLARETVMYGRQDAPAATAAPAGGGSSIGSKVQDYVMVDGKGGNVSMGMGDLKEQLRSQVEAKRRLRDQQQSKKARRPDEQDDIDRMRSTLHSAKAATKGPGRKGFG